MPRHLFHALQPAVQLADLLVVGVESCAQSAQAGIYVGQPCLICRLTPIERGELALF